eukprot:SAG11_NODE_6080_length_1392_cov_1.105955_2_plen_111_part_00
MQPDGLKLSDLQTAAGSRVRKKPQRLAAELSAAAAQKPKGKRARKGAPLASAAKGEGSPKATTATLKRLEETNQRLKVELKNAKAKIVSDHANAHHFLLNFFRAIDVRSG